jgi:hypothetical protein
MNVRRGRTGDTGAVHFEGDRVVHRINRDQPQAERGAAVRRHFIRSAQLGCKHGVAAGHECQLSTDSAARALIRVHVDVEGTRILKDRRGKFRGDGKRPGHRAVGERICESEHDIACHTRNAGMDVRSDNGAAEVRDGNRDIDVLPVRIERHCRISEARCGAGRHLLRAREHCA